MSAHPYRSRALGRALVRLDRQGTAHAVSLGDVVALLRQLGPLYLLMAVACVAVSPLSGIPFVTTACGLTIALLAGQLLIGRRTAWLPGPLRRREIKMSHLQKGLIRADRLAGFIERPLRRRWVWLTSGVVRSGLLGTCLILGLSMPFLEVIPFAGSTFAFVILIIALALIARDGLAAIFAALAVCAMIAAGTVFFV
ncbi:exopolysaccharide biosynthesis protein [Litoreibacter roseus]|uniref:Exopolysaccharide biosynthesis protein n=1 Tax=Litoreibacter roseus TaxID=2601869 RepID=A0A6N6JCV6_9RHOB|nr:exopolysaccharide biosynthesis protein [Litoreibacter roseus]GFE63985.1 hypothetical protein KIN_10590 [Litoreibacter roseus]